MNLYCVNLKSAVFVDIWNFLLNWIFFAFIWLIKAAHMHIFLCRFIQLTNVRFFYLNLMDTKSGAGCIWNTRISLCQFLCVLLTGNDWVLVASKTPECQVGSLFLHWAFEFWCAHIAVVDFSPCPSSDCSPILAIIYITLLEFQFFVDSTRIPVFLEVRT